MVREIEQKILESFLYNNKLKFNEIEKLIQIRSNKLSYYLKTLLRKKILIKTDDFYELSEDFEYVLPYISSKNALLPVLLIFIGDKKKCFLYKRNKRPYKNYLSLPGGRILVGESIKQSVKRIMKEKFNFSADLEKIRSISLEHVRKNKVLYSFFLIFVSASIKDEINLIDINKNKKKIIPSDYLLIKNDIKKEINIRTIFSKI